MALLECSAHRTPLIAHAIKIIKIKIISQTSAKPMNVSPLLYQYGYINSSQLLNSKERTQGYHMPNLYNQAHLELLRQYESLRFLQFYQNSQYYIQNIQNLLLKPTQTLVCLPVKTETEKSTVAREVTVKEEFMYGEQDSTPSEMFSALNFSPDSNLNNLSKKALHYQNGLTRAQDTQQRLSSKELQVKEQASLPQEIDPIKTKLVRMVHYFVTRLGKDQQDRTFHERAFYQSDPRMARVFDVLLKRYSSTGKCREDMSRYVMRKAITFLRDQERKTSNSKARNASVALCRKYFDTNLLNFQSDRELLNELLPYKKDSKNKTPNHDFTRKIFTSKAFCSDYQVYLSKFNEIMEDDNTKKTTHFIDFLVSCVEQDKIEKINQYKRLPWLDVWSESTYIVATEIPLRNSTEESQFIQKRTKHGKL